MNKTNKLDLSINLVEDLVARNGPYNTCMVLEIRDLMEEHSDGVVTGSDHFSSDSLSALLDGINRSGHGGDGGGLSGCGMRYFSSNMLSLRAD